MWDSEDRFLDVLQNIEASLKGCYERDEKITDSMVMPALNKSKIAIQQKFGFGKGRNAHPESPLEVQVNELIVEIGMMRINKINALQLDDFVKLIDKIARSVDTHRQYGVRGYYEFIKSYV